MKRDIRELIPNKRNPRKISPASLKKLVNSLLFFPKMLDVRPLILSENKILGGNMRHKALYEILTMTDIDLNKLIVNNERDVNANELIHYWAEWRKEPLVECKQSGMTSKEERELIIKDNLSYGEFDFDKLDELYGADLLVDFGLIEPESDDDSILEATRAGAVAKDVSKLQFGKYSVELSREQYERLKAKYDNYVNLTGTSFGFITSIMNGNDKN